MTIHLLTQEEYDRLLDIQSRYPKLTFQNNGYEYINRRSFSEEEIAADKEVSDMLSKHIDGFVRFDNFRITSLGELTIRFQYHWVQHFTGVGYLKLTELLSGFENYQEQTTQ